MIGESLEPLGYFLALLVGVLLGALGGGGAILTVPVMVYVFRVGVKQAVPMSLVVVGVTSFIGALRHARAGTLNLRATASFGPAAILGAILGTRTALLVPARVQLLVFAALVLAAALVMLLKRSGAPGRQRPVPFLAAIGAAVGWCTGFVGVGGGFMYVPALSLLAGLDMRTSVGTSLSLIALSSAAGLLAYLGEVPLEWQVVITFTALALVGVAVGSALVPRLPQKALRQAFAVLLLIVGAYVLIRGEG